MLDMTIAAGGRPRFPPVDLPPWREYYSAKMGGAGNGLHVFQSVYLGGYTIVGQSAYALYGSDRRATSVSTTKQLEH